MVPSTVVMPREGSFALASFGRVRKVQEPTFAVALLGITDRNLLFGRCAVHSLNDVGFDAHAVSAPNEKETSDGH